MTDVNTINHGQTQLPAGDPLAANELVTQNPQNQIIDSSGQSHSNIGEQLADEVQGFYREEDAEKLAGEIQDSYKQEDQEKLDKTEEPKKDHAYWYQRVLKRIKKEMNQQKKFLNPAYEKTVEAGRLFTENCDLYAKQLKLPKWLLNSCKKFIGVIDDKHGSRIFTIMNELAEALHESLDFFVGKKFSKFSYATLWSSTLAYSGKRWLVEGLGKNSFSATISKFTHDLIAGIAAPTLIVRAACKVANWFFKAVGMSGSAMNHIVRPVMAFLTGKYSVKILDKWVDKNFIKAVVNPLLNKHREKIDRFFGSKIHTVAKFLGLAAEPKDQKPSTPSLYSEEAIAANQELDNPNPWGLKQEYQAQAA